MTSKLFSENRRILAQNPLGQERAVQRTLADSAAEIGATCLMVHRTARLKEQGVRFTTEATIAKLLFIARHVLER